MTKREKVVSEWNEIIKKAEKRLEDSKICRHGMFMVADRNGVVYKIPSESEIGNSIPFDTVI